jgi:hypothetical protein
VRNGQGCKPRRGLQPAIKEINQIQSTTLRSMFNCVIQNVTFGRLPCLRQTFHLPVSLYFSALKPEKIKKRKFAEGDTHIFVFSSCNIIEVGQNQYNLNEVCNLIEVSAIFALQTCDYEEKHPTDKMRCVLPYL